MGMMVARLRSAPRCFRRGSLLVDAPLAWLLGYALFSSNFQVKPTHSLHTTADELSRHALALLASHVCALVGSGCGRAGVYRLALHR